jgi:hypothetical protein
VHSTMKAAIVAPQCSLSRKCASRRFAGRVGASTGLLAVEGARNFGSHEMGRSSFGPMAVSSIGYVEIVSALTAKARDGKLGRKGIDAAVRLLGST